jgi:hypothetical protein
MIHLKKNADRSLPGADLILPNFSNSYLELIRLLKEAAGIEHLLMLQYLYAAFSIKDIYKDVRGSMKWQDYNLSNAKKETNLFRVAIEEMQHLSMVNAFLSTLGSSPNMLCEDPVNVSDIYPFELKLESLSQESTATYVFVEADKSVFELVNSSSDEQKYVEQINRFINKDQQSNHIGSLYASIIEYANKVSTNPPVFLRKQHIDWNKHLNNMMFIKEEGEVEHYLFFKSVFMGTHPGFNIEGVNGGEAGISAGTVEQEGVKELNIWENHRSSKYYPSIEFDKLQTTAYLGKDNIIRDPMVRKIGWLSNLHYWIIIALLDVNYRNTTMVPKYKAISNMTEALYTCGLILATKGIGIPFDPPNLDPNYGKETLYSLEIIKLMVLEAQNQAYELRPFLKDFNFTIYENTLNGLTEISDSLI